MVEGSVWASEQGSGSGSGSGGDGKGGRSGGGEHDPTEL